MKREEAVSVFKTVLFLTVILLFVSSIIFFLLSFFLVAVILLIVAGIFSWSLFGDNSRVLLKIQKNFVAVVEFKGREIVELTEGWHWIINFFGIDRINQIFDLTDQSMELEIAQGGESGGALGDVDAKDGSLGIKLMIFYRITCPLKAATKTRDVEFFIAKKFEGAIRAYLSQYTMSEIIEHKSKFDLGMLCSSIKIFDKNLINSDSHLKNSSLFMDLAEYGIEPLSISGLDVILPDNIKEKRALSFNVSEELEAEKKNTEKIKEIIKQNEIKADSELVIKKKTADGVFYSIKKEGSAKNEVIKETIELLNGADDNTTNYLITSEKYGNIVKSKDATFFIGDGGNSVEAARQVVVAKKILEKQKKEKTK